MGPIRKACPLLGRLVDVGILSVGASVLAEMNM